MKKPTAAEFRSKVYTDRPAYADFDAPHKFEAIKSIIAKRLIEYPNAICSYSDIGASGRRLGKNTAIRAEFGKGRMERVRREL